MIWTGKFWQRDDSCAIDGFGQQCGRAVWHEVAILTGDPEGNPEIKRKALAHAKATNSATGIRNFISLARTKCAITPDKLDQGQWVLNCESGTVDLRTGKQRPHDQNDYITRCVPVPFDENATCPQFEKFLGEIFNDNEAVIGFVRRLLGYCLTGSTQEQILVIFHGNGANGKSTLVEIVLAILDAYGGMGAEKLLTIKRNDSHPTEVASLHGRRLVVCSETENECEFSEARVKSLTGSDTITARKLYEDESSFRPTHKLIIPTNHKPRVKGTDHAIWRRLRLVPFSVTIPDDKQDRLLSEKLRSELPGILAWLVRGCLEWQREGLNPPAEVLVATSEYRTAEDILSRFIAECCECMPEYSESAATLLDAYKTFSDDRGMTATKLGKRLTDKGFKNERCTAGANKGRWFWKGITLAESAECRE